MDSEYDMPQAGSRIVQNMQNMQNMLIMQNMQNTKTVKFNTSLYFSTQSFMRTTSIIRRQKANEYKMTKTKIQTTELSWSFHFLNI